ncbi:TetR family transcriptional regulator [Mycolicibacterium madagascariense]|uniref:TetR family transcriptional regulator n=1 Tax=Mycolicibacterium madagascariense TaxID=212765 RepID=A0A7I7XA68_9MYCO|nr:TetR/AcrR family transcriptional regulator [Mycolicibacterium madagascariense]MCV7014178.1 TetR/AcrR family transcriptional regulator [Mycolicibacterium madagascariense]BBZ25787.1 TetR family transcriptional regulator [Mycolicibacterium madagascariense]
MPKASPKRGERSRQQILNAAREMFSRVGFAAASTGQIAQAAGVGTRGAVYHHFVDKSALFAAVFEEVLEELMARHVDRFVGLPSDGFSRLKRTIDSYLDTGLDSDLRRIVLDAPAVLGWERFHAVGSSYGLHTIRQLVVDGVRDGSMRAVSPDAMAHLLLVTCEEAALYVGNADDVTAARIAVGEALDALLEGLRNLGSDTMSELTQPRPEREGY